ncbi:FAD-binding oxidoreductase [Paracoccus cavernae]|uniref:FAD-binding oxidoreductase n=1 Tax=Paracoccus cavernae TaxID=1571207 RepID=UPI00362A3976
MIRNYTVSSAPQDEGRYRITVKREGAPSEGIPEGLSSVWLHDKIAAGDEIAVQGRAAASSWTSKASVRSCCCRAASGSRR